MLVLRGSWWRAQQELVATRFLDPSGASENVCSFVIAYNLTHIVGLENTRYLTAFLVHVKECYEVLFYRGHVLCAYALLTAHLSLSILVCFINLEVWFHCEKCGQSRAP